MNQIFTLLLIASCFTTKAAYEGGRLTITNLSPYGIRLELDGHQIGEGNKTITSHFLSGGQYHLKIFRVVERVVADGDIANKVAFEMIYEGNITIKTRYDHDIVINRYCTVTFDELSINDVDYNTYAKSKDEETMLIRDERPGGGLYQPITYHSFRTLVDMMTREMRVAERVKMAKYALDRNYVTAMQVRVLAELIPSSEPAIELVTYAYPKVINKKEFFVVYSAFTRPASREKIAAFVDNYKEDLPAN